MDLHYNMTSKQNGDSIITLPNYPINKIVVHYCYACIPSFEIKCTGDGWLWVSCLLCVCVYLAASTVALDFLSRKWKGFSSLCRSGLGLHSCLNLAGHGQESLLDVGGSLGGGFEEFNAEGVGKFLALLRRNNTLARQIGLITNEKLIDVLGCVSINLVQPLFDIAEGFLVGNIIDNDNSVSAAVVRGCNGAESFLPGCVPDLELDCLSVQLDRSDFEVDTDRRNVGFGVSVIRESKEQTRFTDTGVSNKEQLEQIIAVVVIILMITNIVIVSEMETRKMSLDHKITNSRQLRLTRKARTQIHDCMMPFNPRMTSWRRKGLPFVRPSN